MSKLKRQPTKQQRQRKKQIHRKQLRKREKREKISQRVGTTRPIHYTGIIAREGETPDDGPTTTSFATTAIVTATNIPNTSAFADIPKLVFTENIFPFLDLQDRLEWESYRLVSKGMHAAVESKAPLPPWPEGKQMGHNGEVYNVAVSENHMMVDGRLYDRYGYLTKLPGCVFEDDGGGLNHLIASISIGERGSGEFTTTFFAAAFWGRSKGVKIWSLQEPMIRLAATLDIPDMHVTGIKFSPDGSLMALAGIPKAYLTDFRGVLLYQTSDWTLVKRLAWDRGSSDINLFFCGNSKQLVASMGGNIRTWNLESYAFSDGYVPVPRYNRKSNDMGISKDGKYMAFFRTNTTQLAIWSITNGVTKEVSRYPPDRRFRQPFCTKWSPDGKFIAIGARHGERRIYLLEVLTGAIANVVDVDIAAGTGCDENFTFSNDSQHLFYKSYSKSTSKTVVRNIRGMLHSHTILCNLISSWVSVKRLPSRVS